MSTLKLPDQFHPAWKAFAGLDAEPLGNCLRALQAARPSIDPAGFVRDASDLVPVDEPLRQRVLRMLLSLVAARIEARMSPAETALDLESVVADLGPDFLPLIGWPKFGALVAQIVSLPSLVLTAKAVGVMTQHQRIFKKARAFTDIRPIFGDDLEQGDVGGVIVHTLRIDFRDGDDRNAFYVALDDRDVDELQAVLMRAKEKAAAVRGALPSTRFQLLGDGK